MNCALCLLNVTTYEFAAYKTTHQPCHVNSLQFVFKVRLDFFYKRPSVYSSNIIQHL